MRRRGCPAMVAGPMHSQVHNAVVLAGACLEIVLTMTMMMAVLMHNVRLPL